MFFVAFMTRALSGRNGDGLNAAAAASAFAASKAAAVFRGADADEDSNEVRMARSVDTLYKPPCHRYVVLPSISTNHQPGSRGYFIDAATDHDPRA